MEKILRLNNVEKYYGRKGILTKVINNLSLEVENGSFVAIMGPSGSGKTSLLNCISAIDKVTSGNIYIDDVDIAKLKEKKINEFRRNKLGFVFQDFNLLNTLTGYENIALVLSIQEMKYRDIDNKIKSLAKELDILDILDKYPHQMSGGEKQRIAAARAIINNPKIILADEPTGALDSKSSRLLLESLSYLNKKFKTTILMVTHDIFSACYADRVIFIEDGQIFNEINKENDAKEIFFNKIMNIVSGIRSN